MINNYFVYICITQTRSCVDCSTPAHAVGDSRHYQNIAGLQSLWNTSFTLGLMNDMHMHGHSKLKGRFKMSRVSLARSTTSDIHCLSDLDDEMRTISHGILQRGGHQLGNPAAFAANRSQSEGIRKQCFFSRLLLLLIEREKPHYIA
jgi:hypothetical protein